MIIGGSIEIGIVLLLSVWGLFSPGHGGTNVSGFSPAHIPASNGFFLAVVFTIFTSTGWEASVARGEESRDPRRNVPRGIIWSAVILGVFLLFTSWAQTVGWGTNNMGSLANSSELPSFVLASRFWLSMAIGFSPSAAIFFPTDGRVFSPLVATNLPTVTGSLFDVQASGLTPFPAVA